MNILLLNLTRFGDLLQCQAAITDLHRKGHRVGLVCLPNFLGAAALLKNVEHAFALPAPQVLAALAKEPAGASRPGWHESLASLANWREAVHREFSPDAVCNLTPSVATRLLGLFLAKGAALQGFAIDEQGYNGDSSSWAAFMQAASSERGVSPFNVVDMFRKVAHSWPSGVQGETLAGQSELLGPPADVREKMETTLLAGWRKALTAPAVSVGQPGQAGQGPSQGRRGKKGKRAARAAKASKPCPALLAADAAAVASASSESEERVPLFVALQLGASEERRRWPLEYFVELGARLWQQAGMVPVLLGSQSEQVLAERYAALARHPFVSLCGQTNLQELAGALCAVRLLVTNDTGTMHLAAGLGRPVLAIFLATAQPFDTGPYLAGSCSVEPAMDCHPCRFGQACDKQEACRRAVPVDVIAELAMTRLHEGRFALAHGSAGEAAHAARVWQAVDGAEGFTGLLSLSGHDREARYVWLTLLRHHLRRFLDTTGEYTAVPCTEGLAPCPLLLKEAVPCAQRAVALLNLLQQQGKVLSVNPVPMMRERFVSTWKKVREALESSARFKPLVLLWDYRTQADGLDLPAIGAVAGEFSVLLQALVDDLQGSEAPPG